MVEISLRVIFLEARIFMWFLGFGNLCISGMGSLYIALPEGSVKNANVAVKVLVGTLKSNLVH